MFEPLSSDFKTILQGLRFWVFGLRFLDTQTRIELSQKKKKNLNN